MAETERKFVNGVRWVSTTDPFTFKVEFEDPSITNWTDHFSKVMKEMAENEHLRKRSNQT